MKPRYRRALLKIGGEVFSASEKTIEKKSLESVATEIEDGFNLGTALGIVVGGGNIFRGQNASALGIDRVTGDYMGMLGTMIDALALQDCLGRRGIPAKVMSAIDMNPISERYVKERAMSYLDDGKTVIFSCGTGNPYFTTDTAASLRAIEMEAELLLKGTKVDGIYEEDPLTNPGAKRFGKLNYLEVLNRNLRIMDATAVSLCMEHQLPVIVFDIYERGNLGRVLLGEEVGTTIGR